MANAQVGTSPANDVSYPIVVCNAFALPHDDETLGNLEIGLDVAIHNAVKRMRDGGIPTCAYANHQLTLHFGSKVVSRCSFVNPMCMLDNPSDEVQGRFVCAGKLLLGLNGSPIVHQKLWTHIRAVLQSHMSGSQLLLRCNEAYSLGGKDVDCGVFDPRCGQFMWDAPHGATALATEPEITNAPVGTASVIVCDTLRANLGEVSELLKAMQLAQLRDRVNCSTFESDMAANKERACGVLPTNTVCDTGNKLHGAQQDKFARAVCRNVQKDKEGAALQAAADLYDKIGFTYCKSEAESCSIVSPSCYPADRALPTSGMPVQSTLPWDNSTYSQGSALNVSALAPYALMGVGSVLFIGLLFAVFFFGAKYVYSYCVPKKPTGKAEEMEMTLLPESDDRGDHAVNAAFVVQDESAQAYVETDQ
eukprot:GHVQ01041293.1.p1 GENE.GHVQ01041293.1~~GHVQ01041293.1.p1  ORF type:complete len:420 (-),score=30.06 GHVQ01041293.1:582-1841(-)